MDKDQMNEIQENASQFVLGLFSFSSLVLKILSVIDIFKSRKNKKNEKSNKLVEEEES